MFGTASAPPKAHLGSAQSQGRIEARLIGRALCERQPAAQKGKAAAKAPAWAGVGSASKWVDRVPIPISRCDACSPFGGRPSPFFFSSPSFESVSVQDDDADDGQGEWGQQ